LILHRRADVADGIVWLSRFIVVIIALTFIALITAKLTSIEHDTLETDAKLQESHVIKTLSAIDSVSGELNLGVLDEKTILDIGERKSIDWKQARPQQYILRLQSSSGLKDDKKWFVKSLEYLEALPYLKIEGEGKSRTITHNYYVLYQKSGESIPIPALLEVTTIEKG